MIRVEYDGDAIGRGNRADVVSGGGGSGDGGSLVLIVESLDQVRHSSEMEAKIACFSPFQQNRRHHSGMSAE